MQFIFCSPHVLAAVCIVQSDGFSCKHRLSIGAFDQQLDGRKEDEMVSQVLRTSPCHFQQPCRAGGNLQGRWCRSPASRVETRARLQLRRLRSLISRITRAKPWVDAEVSAAEAAVEARSWHGARRPPYLLRRPC